MPRHFGALIPSTNTTGELERTRQQRQKQTVTLARALEILKAVAGSLWTPWRDLLGRLLWSDQSLRLHVGTAREQTYRRGDSRDQNA